MDNIFFIGLRASGKSTLAEKVAQRLNLACLDTDLIIGQKIDQTIAEFVEKNSWPAFRQIETDVLRFICRQKAQVVATGGGIVLKAENRKLLNDSGIVFYLQADVPLLVNRLQLDPKVEQRPALSDKNLSEEIYSSLKEREPYYLECQDHILQASNPLEELVQEVLNIVERDR